MKNANARHTHNYSIDFNNLLAQFNGKISDRMRDMRTVIRSVEDSGYQEPANRSGSGAVLDLRVSHIAPTSQIIQRQINTTVQKIVEDFINYLELLLAIRSITDGGRIELERTITQSEVADYINQYITNKQHEISTDTSMSVTNKIDDFVVEKSIKMMARGLNNVRVTFTHHSGRSKKDYTIIMTSFELLINGDLIPSFPLTAEEGGVIALRTKEKKIEIQKGNEVMLSEADVETIVMTLQTQIAPAYLKSLNGNLPEVDVKQDTNRVQ